ncbi:MAG: hypothetical protein JNJ57_21915, partial [Saprospiraceae bacterium]|nr:hypothetical protein [Saprospiraceae bacterium]
MPLSPLNYLTAGAKDGKFQTKGDAPSSPEQVDQLFEHLEKTKAPRLALYFHGGLVSTKIGIGIAENMVGVFKDVTHPVSVVWETGAVKTMIDDFSVITESDLFKDLRDWVLKKLGENFGGLGGVKGKASFNEKTLEEGLQKRQPF